MPVWRIIGVPFYGFVFVKLLFAALNCIFALYMKALIYKSTGSWYVAGAENGKVYNTRLKGVFKIDGLNSTNPVAVGDEVERFVMIRFLGVMVIA